MTSPFDSIYAPATPSGTAERAVVRLTGAEVLAEVSGWLGHELPRERGRIEGMWPLGSSWDEAAQSEHRGGKTLADLPSVSLPVALQIFPGPASYTGEDLIEIHLPGSPLILETVMGSLERMGLRLAWPGEFTRRAFENGKMDLAEVEAVLALIHSRDEQDLIRASAVLAGEPGLSATPHAQELLELLALLEAGLDFEDGETGEVSEQLWRPRIEALVRDLTAVEGKLGRTALDLALPGFLLLGPPNAGKTSLWNLLQQQELERSNLTPGLVSGTSPTAPGLISGEAGTTRDLRWLRIPSMGLRLGDSPGRELWSDPGEDQELRILKEALAQSSGYLWLEPLGSRWKGAPAELGVQPVLSLATRADEAPAGCTESLPAGVRVISVGDPVSIDRLRECLGQLPGASPMGEAFLGMLLGRLHRARDILIRALDPALDLPELVAAELREALALLEPEQARQVPEEILDRIFGRFCLGK